jgi:immunity protein, SdpI family
MRNKLAWFEAALVIAPFVVIAGFWNQMPELIPIHWNIRGEIDGWASKSFGLLITPLIGFLAVALCHVVSWLDPKLRANLDKTDRMNKVMQILRLAFAAFFDAVFGVQLAVAFGHKIAAARVLAWCLLLLFAILGNYLPNLRPNYLSASGRLGHLKMLRPGARPIGSAGN